MDLDLINIKYSEEVLRENSKEFTLYNWRCISKYQKLSEDFIREFKDKVSWFKISSYQKLSENFITEFKEEVDWDYISQFQELSLNFIVEHRGLLNHLWLTDNKHLTQKDKAKLKLLGIL